MKEQLGLYRWWMLGVAWIVAALVIFLLTRGERLSSSRNSDSQKPAAGGRMTGNIAREGSMSLSRNYADAQGSSLTAEETVAAKLSQFARHRFEVAKAMARQFNVDISSEIAAFFAAANAGQWEEELTLFESLKKQNRSENPPQNLQILWPVILETFGVADEAREWPAERLLDYGHAILDSLRPGMVYVGGTDPGRFIPTLLNETSEGEHHIVLTQNALADNSYLRYLGFLYSDRLQSLNNEDSQRAFQQYLSDAKQRALHDQNLPDEPKQVRPGEDIQMADNRVQVSGQVAVMSINEKLLQFLMEKNPDATFAIEQSFPLASTYAAASPLGPIMELRVSDQENALTADRASESVQRWREMAQQFLSDAEAVDSSARKVYSKMAAEQASLFLYHHYTDQAEQAFRIATDLCPSSPEALFRYANLLVEQKRFDEAARLAENGLRAAPGNEQFRDLAAQLRTLARN